MTSLRACRSITPSASSLSFAWFLTSSQRNRAIRHKLTLRMIRSLAEYFRSCNPGIKKILNSNVFFVHGFWWSIILGLHGQFCIWISINITHFLSFQKTIIRLDSTFLTTLKFKFYLGSLLSHVFLAVVFDKFPLAIEVLGLESASHLGELLARTDVVGFGTRPWLHSIAYLGVLQSRIRHPHHSVGIQTVIQHIFKVTSFLNIQRRLIFKRIFLKHWINIILRLGLWSHNLIYESALIWMWLLVLFLRLQVEILGHSATTFLLFLDDLPYTGVIR